MTSWMTSKAKKDAIWTSLRGRPQQLEGKEKKPDSKDTVSIEKLKDNCILTNRPTNMKIQKKAKVGES